MRDLCAHIYLPWKGGLFISNITYINIQHILITDDLLIFYYYIIRGSIYSLYSHLPIVKLYMKENHFMIISTIIMWDKINTNMYQVLCTKWRILRVKLLIVYLFSKFCVATIGLKTVGVHMLLEYKVQK